MAVRAFQVGRIINANSILIHRNLLSTSVVLPLKSILEEKENKPEKNLKLFGDPDTFGTLGTIKPHYDVKLEDEGDKQEEDFIRNLPLPSQKLTTKQYADMIKDYLKFKRLKEAIDVLEVRMLKVDRAKPENYIYNILIGACADVGYTKKAFKLFNDMKRRDLKPSGDTYTCLFNACANSPWPADGLKNAKHLKQLMVEKGIEPNLTNYNSMIKAFGRCGDLASAFKIVDEMVSKRIKIRVHTFNHLLQACIADKENGLRHALIVWRKMLIAREKPNIYSFNLMLKCVKDCGLGSIEDFEEVISVVQNHLALLPIKPKFETKSTKLLSAKSIYDDNYVRDNDRAMEDNISENNFTTIETKGEAEINKTDIVKENALAINKKDDISLEFVNNYNKPAPLVQIRTTPNLLSVNDSFQKVISIQDVKAVQDRFAIIGGQDDFLKEMEVYSVKPDIKTFTQMLFVVENNKEAELKLLETMQQKQLLPDIDFYNMLIKRRCLRFDYDGAFEVKELIEEEIKRRKRKFFMKKKKHLKMNIMTYGVLALACKTQVQAEKLLSEMKEMQIKLNMEILGSLLRQGTANNSFDYIQYVMKIVEEENIHVNHIFIKHLESFNERCMQIMEQKKMSKSNLESYKTFLIFYNKWLKSVNAQEALHPEHPWAQFKESQPETIQRQDIEIREPKRFLKRHRRHVKYVPRAM